ncbi:MAG: hypothetical protein ABFC63_08785 [Thermoguttaceae bacterium]
MFRSMLLLCGLSAAVLLGAALVRADQPAASGQAATLLGNADRQVNATPVARFVYRYPAYYSGPNRWYVYRPYRYDVYRPGRVVPYAPYYYGYGYAPYFGDTPYFGYVPYFGYGYYPNGFYGPGPVVRFGFGF